jgi:predicted nucleotidyltransferase
MVARTRELVLGRLEENREALMRFGVKSLGLFGSAARGESTASSDLDFVVEFERNTFDAYMGLKEFLEGLFGCPVDLVLAHTLKPRLREPVLPETIHAQGL